MELVVLSGKGGTGKTTIATALSELTKDVIRIDCDVDAPNFYLFYKGTNIESSDFIGGKKAIINEDLCLKCEKCKNICKFGAINNFKVNPLLCEGCGACNLVCHNKAITLEDEKIAEVFVTKLDKGIISRAQMNIGADGSGKLISHLRKIGKKFNSNEKLTIIDGSPGIGCPVISSITGSDLVLIVTEPTKSGLLDLERVLSLCEHFKLTSIVCINKYDINQEMSLNIENFLKKNQIKLVGKIPYDDTVRESINNLKPITNYANSSAKEAIVKMWLNIKKLYLEVI